ncbi:segregation and condensation protein B [Povalibacter uvarum]|uniref:Segregation and condensation protein B n=1 Tax=Povalibacter uvarum TaxID=732238 RepID=A0A841HGA2_9GAMM|nr:SMC-Scp complex subunit ScpB [Povalibacter uvarum]MBB6091927.1 segregation and condensation protein B [Povalibacter uvarum]
MNEQDLKHIIEATLLAAGRPVTTQQLLDLFDERDRPTPEQLQASIDLLIADYESRGIEVMQVASGWRIQVRPRAIDVVSRLWQERPARYSRALLETLALVAYRQPITRSEIEEIRGVSISSTIMRTMQERNWIRVVGHREVPGRPELLGTTREFLDYFGLKSLDQLPTLADLRDVENIGVQLELPAGEATAAAAEAEGETQAEAVADGQYEAGESEATAEDPELSADAEEGEEVAQEDSDDSETPTLVASGEAEADEQSAVREPPSE